LIRFAPSTATWCFSTEPVPGLRKAPQVGFFMCQAPPCPGAIRPMKNERSELLNYARPPPMRRRARHRRGVCHLTGCRRAPSPLRRAVDVTEVQKPGLRLLFPPASAPSAFFESTRCCQKLNTGPGMRAGVLAAMHDYLLMGIQLQSDERPCRKIVSRTRS
jgi:hypothetical protein